MSVNPNRRETYEAMLKKYDLSPKCHGGVSSGWVPMIDTLISKLIALGWDKKIDQIKEKLGGLRFYVGEVPEEMRELINECEAKSFKVCEECGAPGKSTGEFWIKTLCRSCNSKREY